MPILKKENDIYPKNLLDKWELLADEGRVWWAVYTMSRREKDLMRKLYAEQIPFYGPVITKRFRSPNGRLRTSFVPLFPNYVFMFGSEAERYQAMTTNCVSRYQQIGNAEYFVADLKKVQTLVESGVPLTPESKLAPGKLARIRTGPFAGFEGTVIRREGKSRFLVLVNFIEQGVSMEIDEGLLAPI